MRVQFDAGSFLLLLLCDLKECDNCEMADTNLLSGVLGDDDLRPASPDESGRGLVDGADDDDGSSLDKHDSGKAKCPDAWPWSHDLKKED